MTDSQARELSRRDFVTLALSAGFCCLLPGSLGATLTGKTKNGNYYLAHREELLKAFRDTNDGAREYLRAKYGENLARGVCRQAAARFEALLPHFPDVGGEVNLMVRFLPIAAWYLAFYGPMKAQGKSAEDVGRLVYDLNVVELARIPREKAQAEGARQFSREYVEKLRGFCAWTQKREYPGNWVAHFVPGDGQEFDYGYDYTECALVKYLRARGAAEVGPFVCLNDFIQSRTFGTGLQRTKTLAQGDAICNFRYQQGRPVTQDWSTEVPRFRRAG